MSTATPGPIRRYAAVVDRAGRYVGRVDRVVGDVIQLIRETVDARAAARGVCLTAVARVGHKVYLKVSRADLQWIWAMEDRVAARTPRQSSDTAAPLVQARSG